MGRTPARFLMPVVAFVLNLRSRRHYTPAAAVRQTAWRLDEADVRSFVQEKTAC
jgi:hypothetical protein